MKPSNSSSPTSGLHALAVRRAVLPEVLDHVDLADALMLPSEAAALRLMRRGEVGPSLRLGRRRYILRTSFLAHLAALAARETHGSAPANCHLPESGANDGPATVCNDDTGFEQPSDGTSKEIYVFERRFRPALKPDRGGA